MGKAGEGHVGPTRKGGFAMKKSSLIQLALAVVAALALAGCGGGGSSSSTRPPGTDDTVGVQGNLTGTAAPAVVTQALLTGDVAVLMVDEAGAQISQVVTPADGSFNLRVPEGHDYVMVFREGGTAGRTLGILVADAATGQTTFTLASGAADIDLGDIVLDSILGKASCQNEDLLDSAAVGFADLDGDGIPNVCDNSADEDADGIADVDDDAPFEPLEVVSLKEYVEVFGIPEPINLGLFLKAGEGTNAGGFPNVDPVARAAALKLGKALFWDMAIGSDVQACASCHFQGGADIRAMNNGHHGADGLFDVAGPHEEVRAADFPYVQFSPVDEGIERGGVRVRNVDDVMGSQGVFFTQFTDIVLGDFLEKGTSIVDAVFNVNGTNTRRVTGRNAPPAVNAVFNFTNFWDGRARNIFNGVNPFGELDMNSGVFALNTEGAIVQEIVRIPDSSLASQAVGPPGSDVEMTFAGRPFVKIGKKVLNAGLKPLARQVVSPTDSVLGALADEPTGLKEIVAGENPYVTLVKQAFNEKYWNAQAQYIEFIDGVPTVVAGAADPSNTNQYTMMEANFSLFFGLAVQIYEATLVSDDSKFDRAMAGLEEFTEAEKDGFTTFFGGGHCSRCHSGPLFTNHTVADIRGGEVPQAPGFLPANAIKIADNAFVDIGFSNIAVRPTAEDLGWGGNSPFINPRTGEPFPLAFARLALLKRDGLLPDEVAMFVPELPGVVSGDRVIVDGTFKVSGLRNVELTGPYFHTGGAATLLQVVEFYTRMGNFPQENALNIDPDFQEIGKLRGSPGERDNLVAFLLTLTDERVKFERAPFDHPQLFLPAGDGLQGAVPSPPLGFAAGENHIELPAVGAAGRAEPLQTFLNLEPVTGGIPE
jgi:cytochrome c peroxidase